jgi:ABC-type dipeptide/oligopeptide/nickel transport system permease subunit
VRRFRTRSWLAGTAFAGLVLFCALWPEVAPFGPNEIDFDRSREGASLAHPFGTDQFGRDMLTRLAAAGRVSLAITGLALAVILVVGFIYGAVAALAGGRVDAALMRILDGLLALPRLPISIVLIIALNQSAMTIWAVVLALAVVSWMLTARLVRGHVLVLREAAFMRAAKAVGARRRQILLRHVLPNTLGVLVVAVLLELPGVILGEAFLSVLGLGPNPPTPTWGNMAVEGVHFHRISNVALPSAAIAVFAILANLLADSLQEKLDPRRTGVAADG